MATAAPTILELDIASEGRTVRTEIGQRPHMHRDRDAESTPRVAANILMRFGVKVKILIKPSYVLIAGRCRLAGGIFPWNPTNVPGHTRDTPAEPLPLATDATTRWVRDLKALSLQLDALLQVTSQFARKNCLKSLQSRHYIYIIYREIERWHVSHDICSLLDAFCEGLPDNIQ